MKPNKTGINTTVKQKLMKCNAGYKCWLDVNVFAKRAYVLNNFSKTDMNSEKKLIKIAIFSRKSVSFH